MVLNHILGKLPSPSPTYPQEIKNVEGRNYFDKTNPYTNNWYNDQGVEQTSTITGHFANNIEVKPNQQYKISGMLIVPGLNVANFRRIYFYDTNGNWISRSADITTTTYTFTAPSNCKYINFQLVNDQSSYAQYCYNKSLDTFKLKEVPELIQIKKVNKNLAVINDGTYGLYRVINPIPVKANDQITVIANYTNTNSYPNAVIRPTLYSNETMTSLIQEFSNMTKDTDAISVITIPQDGYFGIGAGYGVSSVVINKLFVGQGEYTLADYIPHAEKTYNFPLSEGQKLMQGGTIDGKVKNIREHTIFNGNDEWTIYTETHSGYTRFRHNVNISVPADLRSTNALCNSFQLNDTGSDTVENILDWRANGMIFLNTNVANTVEALQTYLTSNPIIVEHPVATPTETNFTPEQQAVYNEIISDGTYNPVTHYSTNATLNPDIDMSYYRDLPTIISNLENA